MTPDTKLVVPICCYCDHDLSCAHCGREHPSDPTPPDREAIARIIYSHSNNPQLWDHPFSASMKARAYEDADRILALRGGE